MPRASPIQGDFSGGEFSPLLYGRVENPRYKASLALCKNFLPMLQGPVTRRPGTVNIAPTKYAPGTANSNVRLIPFKYSVTQDYMLEVGHYYIRFYANRTQLVTPSNYTLNITTAGGVVAGNVYTDGTRSYTVLNSTLAAGNAYFEVTGGVPPSSGTLTFVSGFLTASLTYSGVTATPGLNVPYEVATVYPASDVDGLKYAQSLDVLYLVHANHPPYNLNRYGNTNWTFVIMTLVDGPYLDEGIYPTNRVGIGTPSFPVGLAISSGGIGATVDISTSVTGVGGHIVNVTNNGVGNYRITLNSGVDPANIYADQSQVFIEYVTGTTGANGTWTVKQISAFVYDLVGSTFAGSYAGGGGMFPAPFMASDVGRLIRVGEYNATTQTTVWSYVQQNGYTDGANITAQVIYQDPLWVGGGGNTQKFAFGVYSPTDGYPSCVVFHEDRLWFGAPGISLVRVDGSTVSNYTNFAPSLTNDGTVVASNACSFSLNSHDQNAIEWMKSDELGMPIGTQGGPWILRPSILSEAISPTNISAKKVTNVGSSPVDGVTCAKATLFIETSTRKLRELTYFYQIGGFRVIDLTETAEHLPGSGISTELVYQAFPIPTVWCARADGTLLSITYDRQLDALRAGWAQHSLGGTSDNSGTQPLITSLGIIPSPDATVDDLWLIVTRYINGVQIQSVEYMSKIFQNFDEQVNAVFLDYSVSHTFGSPVATISGLTGYENMSVVAYTDGYVQGPLTVSNTGVLTLPIAATVVTIGFPYTSQAQQLVLDAGSADGTSIGKNRRTNEMSIMLNNCGAFQYGDNFTTNGLTEYSFRQPSDPMDAATPLFTGTVDRLQIESDYDLYNQVCVQVQDPVPFTIVAIMPQQTTYDRA